MELQAYMYKLDHIIKEIRRMEDGRSTYNVLPSLKSQFDDETKKMEKLYKQFKVFQVTSIPRRTYDKSFSNQNPK